MLTAIADVYNAMTSDRVYRTGRCPFDVIRELEENGKTLYAPEILIPIMERIAQSYISHTVRLSTDEEGEIVMLNRDFLSKPLVKVENRNKGIYFVSCFLEWITCTIISFMM